MTTSARRPARRVPALTTLAAVVLGMVLATADAPAQAQAQSVGTQVGSRTPAAAPVARTIRACVDRRSGQVRIRLTRSDRCRAGERSVTWPRAGARGPNGAAGAAGAAGATGSPGRLVVRGADGTTLGQFLSAFASGPPLVFVLIDGGMYLYLTSGQPFSPSTQVRWTDAACAGTPYVRIDPNDLPAQDGATLLGGWTRFLRVNDAGTVSAFRPTGEVTPVNPGGQLLYQLTGTDTCQVANGGVAYTTGRLYALSAVAAPPTVPGPLSIGR